MSGIEQLFIHDWLAVTSAPKASSDSSAAWLAWLGTGVALVAAVGAIWSAWRERSRSNRLSELAHRRAQLNEFYGPLIMWRAASAELRKILPDKNEDGTDWRLVDHIEEVKRGEHPEWLRAAEEILKIGSKVDELLVGKAGLSWTIPPPPSFAKALAHSALLHLYWDLGKDQPEKNRIPFPRPEFDNDIRDAVTALKARIVELGGAAPNDG